ncbi:MAG: hypothetical protein V1702_02670 [Candidatus Woesearchaeota archaeon]
MKNFILITAVIISILFLAGCQTGDSGTTSTGTPYIGGTNGLLISFLDNSPPAQVSDGGQFPFQIVVLLENAGEANISKKKANVTISGLYPSDFGVAQSELSNSNEDDIIGMKKDSAGNKIQGMTAQVIIPKTEGKQLAFKRSLSAGNIELPIQTNVCYSYKTMASGKYCLRQNPVSTVAGVCEASGPKEIFSSASPIGVDSLVESFAGGNTININFRISKKGNGNVFKWSPDNEGAVCGQTAGSKVSDQNIVNVTVGVPEDPATPPEDRVKITCYGLSSSGDQKNKGAVRLDNQGNAMVSCKIANNAQVDAVREVLIEVLFDYSEVRSSSLIVQRLLG